MAATTIPRNTARLGPPGIVHRAPVAASQKALQGTIAVVASGYFRGGATATGHLAVGAFPATYDNSSGSAGDVVGQVEEGIFRFANSSAGDAIAATDRGAACYVVDNQTVAKTDGGATRSPAGIIHDVDSEGVWVRMSAEIARLLA